MSDDHHSLGGVEPHHSTGGIQYGRALRYVFDSPNWVANLLFGSLCVLSTQLIPLVGQMVLIGYQFEIVEKLHGRAARYPDFDLDRFVEYLMRGLWVLLAAFLLSLVYLPLLALLVVAVLACSGLLIASTGGEADGALIGVVAMLVLLIPLVFIWAIGCGVLATPVLLRAGLSQDFSQIFDLSFVRDYLRRTWRETTVVTIFSMALSFVLLLLGSLVLCVGVFPAAAYLTLVQGYLYLELYQLYLARGGQKIPLKACEPLLAEAV